jgi:8-oxo-dGTP pyrophosphatase MutT (NUDIX family)
MRNSIQKHNYTYRNDKFLKKVDSNPYLDTVGELEMPNSILNEQYCNNCRKQGHLYHQCKLPITSIGIIVFRINNQTIEYLMICRKDTLGYIDFMRGKYSIFDRNYIMNMLKQMTNEEKTRLKTLEFDELWSKIWGDDTTFNQYKMEESISKEKFYSLRNGLVVKNDFYTLEKLVEESMIYDSWKEPEWGFPKGRRNYQEQEYDCALREFEEETGYKSDYLQNIQNFLPFEEIFTGSNYKSYKHKYYLTFMNKEHTLEMKPFQRTEVSQLAWKTYDECILAIRPYNVEKIKLITNIHSMLSNYRIIQM